MKAGTETAELRCYQSNERAKQKSCTPNQSRGTLHPNLPIPSKQVQTSVQIVQVQRSRIRLSSKLFGFGIVVVPEVWAETKEVEEGMDKSSVRRPDCETPRREAIRQRFWQVAAKYVGRYERIKMRTKRGIGWCSERKELS